MTVPARMEPWLATVKPPLAAALGALASARARDLTDSLPTSRLLVLAPHPDDETLGCGATLARAAAAGSEPEVVVVTDGATWPPGRGPEQNRAGRRAELAAATTALGLSSAHVRQLDLPEGRLSELGDVVVEAVAAQLRRVRPVAVLVTAPSDPHADHAALGSATMRAVAGSDIAVLAYVVWHWERPNAWLRLLRSARRPVAVSTQGQLDRKQAAVAAYPSQLHRSAGGELDQHGLRPDFLRHFLGASELFFPLTGPSL